MYAFRFLSNLTNTVTLLYITVLIKFRNVSRNTRRKFLFSRSMFTISRYLRSFWTSSTSTCRHIEMLLNAVHSSRRKIEVAEYWRYIHHTFPLIRDWRQGKLAGFLKSQKHRRRIVTGVLAGSTIFRARFSRNRNARRSCSAVWGRFLVEWI